MRRLYLATAALLLLVVVAQFYLAAVGAFANPHTDGAFTLHRISGMASIPTAALLATVAAVLARARRRLIALTITPVGLVIMQVGLTEIGQRLAGSTEQHTTPAARAFLGLHALNGLAILMVALAIVLRARNPAAIPKAAEPEAPFQTSTVV